MVDLEHPAQLRRRASPAPFETADTLLGSDPTGTTANDLRLPLFGRPGLR